MYNLGAEFTIVNCLFGAAKLTKDVDVDNYGYTGYGIGFDARSFFSVRNGSRCGKILFLVQTIVYGPMAIARIKIF